MFYRIVFNHKTCVWNIQIAHISFLGIINLWRTLRLGSGTVDSMVLGFDNLDEAKKFVVERGLNKVYNTLEYFHSQVTPVYVVQQPSATL